MQEMVLDKTPVVTNINVSSFSHSPIISAEGYELNVQHYYYYYYYYYYLLLLLFRFL